MTSQALNVETQGQLNVEVKSTSEIQTTIETKPSDVSSQTRTMKVPEVTIYFWIIKVCATTVGETFADFLTSTLNSFGKCCAIMFSIWFVFMVAQLKLKLYVPPVYWFVVVATSIVGTLLTDNLTDNLGVQLWISSLGFAIILSVVFYSWYRVENTLDIHSIYTLRRELFYWFAILFTFALGTAFGDLVSGYLYSFAIALAVFAAAIIIFAGLWAKKILNPITSFWFTYILTRPLGASIGDLVSQPRPDGGLGAGTTYTSVVLLVIIVILVAYLTYTGKDKVQMEVKDEQIDA